MHSLKTPSFKLQYFCYYTCSSVSTKSNVIQMRGDFPHGMERGLVEYCSGNRTTTITENIFDSLWSTQFATQIKIMGITHIAQLQRHFCTCTRTSGTAQFKLNQLMSAQRPKVIQWCCKYQQKWTNKFPLRSYFKLSFISGIHGDMPRRWFLCNFSDNTRPHHLLCVCGYVICVFNYALTENRNKQTMVKCAVMCNWTWFTRKKGDSVCTLETPIICVCSSSS